MLKKESVEEFVSVASQADELRRDDQELGLTTIRIAASLMTRGAPYRPSMEGSGGNIYPGPYPPYN